MWYNGGVISSVWSFIALGAVLVMFAAWVASTMDFSVFAEPWRRFRRRSLPMQAALAFVACSAILYGGSKSRNHGTAQDPLSVRSEAASESQAYSDAETFNTNLFAITAFEVDAANRAVGFSLGWDPAYISTLNSRYVDLFMTLNLPSNDWFRLDGFELPVATTACALAFNESSFPSELRPVFSSAFTNGSSAFFVFGLDSDTDGDFLTDAYEKYVAKTSPLLADTDEDGLHDGDEIVAGANPFVRDTDGDGFVDGSDPNPIGMTPMDDSDGDGIPDAAESSSLKRMKKALFGLTPFPLGDCAHNDRTHLQRHNRGAYAARDARGHDLWQSSL